MLRVFSMCVARGAESRIGILNIENSYNINSNVRVVVCSFKFLYKAMRKCVLDVRWKDSVAGYLNHGLVNCYKLEESLDSDTYEISAYITFIVYEPKMRPIVSTRIKDRVFQRSLCDNYLYAAITKSFIYDNCACQIGKGTDFALKRLGIQMQKFVRKHGIVGCVLKCDIKNYFGSTPHSVAKAAIARCVSDEWAFTLVCDIIDSFDQGEDPDVGMGLGSQITQLTQLAVLDPLDHFIKKKLKIKCYIRYMDDFILIHESIEYLKYCREEIRKQLGILSLTLSEKKTKTFPLSQGINFLGFTFWLTDTGKLIKELSRENISHERRKLRKQKALADRGVMTKEQCNECFKSWKAHAERGDTHNLVLEMDKYYKELWSA